MNRPSMMNAQTLSVLRHIAVHGPQSKTDIEKFLKELTNARSTISNLHYLGYLAADKSVNPHTYALTNKARTRLASPDLPRAVGTGGGRKPRSTPLQAMTFTVHDDEYRCGDLNASPRPGAMRAFSLPSRFGDRLHYRDGRVTDMAGNAIE